MTAPDAQRITAFFDQVASDWDEMRLAYYDESVIERLAAAADVRAGMTVGDIGTGTGFVAALTAASGLWVLADMPAKPGSDPHPAAAPGLTASPAFTLPSDKRGSCRQGRQPRIP